MTSACLSRLGLMLVLCAAVSSHAAAADPDAGKRLTQLWCTGCHVVGGSNRGSDAAPSLPAMAKQKGQDPHWVKAWLEAPHPPMPNLNLSRQEIDDISAYLASLPNH